MDSQLAPEDSALLESARRAWRSRRIRNVAAACAPAACYLFFVWHYSFNIPFADDWTKATLVVAATHGHLHLGALWTQYAEGRLFVPNLVFVVVGRFDHFNLKVMVGLSGVSLVAGFFLLLSLLRTYLARPLTPLPILALGVIWFSLADTGNSLWAFQFAWYLVIFFLILMLYFLIAWQGRPVLRITFAVIAAVAGTLSMFQGFFLWPVGLICILWSWENNRVHITALMVWLTAAGATLGVFMHQYRMSYGCNLLVYCSPRTAIDQPAHYGSFFAAMVGYVVPRFGPLGPRYIGFHELLGLGLCAGALLVLVQSLRERRTSDRPPLAFALVVFALLFDLSIALGRGAGPIVFGSATRFTMPNVVLIAGLVIYACAHVPRVRWLPSPRGWQRRLHIAAFVTLSAFVLAQAVFTTESGIAEGRTWNRIQATEADVLANRDLLLASDRNCYLNIYVANGVARGSAIDVWLIYIDAISAEHLYIFDTKTRRKYRSIGPPYVAGVCYLTSATFHV